MKKANPSPSKKPLLLFGFFMTLMGMTIVGAVAVFFCIQLHAQTGEQKVEKLLSQMTLDEKIEMMGGTGFDTVPIPRLEIPAIRMTDGAAGVVGENATAFPAPIAMAATWDPELVAQTAAAIARESKAHGRNMLLGPCVNIQRTPFGGRNFESFGEDPYLASRLGAEYVRGVQAEGVIATPKHFALNNQEYQRQTVSVEVGERALNEIYLPAFLSMVREGAWSVMAAYNRIWGQYATASDLLLNKILKDSWGFKGFVVSDWGATHDTALAARGGLDLEMPWGLFFSPEKVINALSAGEISQEIIDDKVRRLLRAIVNMNVVSNPSGELNLIAQRAIARAVGSESVILLKNQAGILPIRKNIRKITLAGPFVSQMPTGGGGSSFVSPLFSTSPTDALKERLPEVEIESVLVSTSKDIFRAVRSAATSDLVIAFVGLDQGIETEGLDRATLGLPALQNALLFNLAMANPNLVVVVNSGGPETMPWIHGARAVVQTWYLGQESGETTADILTGTVNPSGKLPGTFLKRWKDSSAYGFYPGQNGVVRYDEGVFVGYRHFDKEKINPLFPFGHGLSYTKFGYQKLKIISDPTNKVVKISFEVSNLGPLAGAEVAQVYIGPEKQTPASVVKELKRFKRVFLNPGDATEISFELGIDDISSYDEVLHHWIRRSGIQRVYVGSSSRDIRLRGTF